MSVQTSENENEEDKKDFEKIECTGIVGLISRNKSPGELFLEISPKNLKKVLPEKNVPLLIKHNYNYEIGRSDNFYTENITINNGTRKALMCDFVIDNPSFLHTLRKCIILNVKNNSEDFNQGFYYSDGFLTNKELQQNDRGQAFTVETALNSKLPGLSLGHHCNKEIEEISLCMAGKRQGTLLTKIKYIKGKRGKASEIAKFTDLFASMLSINNLDSIVKVNQDMQQLAMQPPDIRFAFDKKSITDGGPDVYKCVASEEEKDTVTMNTVHGSQPIPGAAQLPVINQVPTMHNMASHQMQQHQQIAPPFQFQTPAAQPLAVQPQQMYFAPPWCWNTLPTINCSHALGCSHVSDHVQPNSLSRKRKMEDNKTSSEDDTAPLWKKIAEIESDVGELEQKVLYQNGFLSRRNVGCVPPAPVYGNSPQFVPFMPQPRQQPHSSFDSVTQQAPLTQTPPQIPPILPEQSKPEKIEVNFDESKLAKSLESIIQQTLSTANMQCPKAETTNPPAPQPVPAEPETTQTPLTFSLTSKGKPDIQKMMKEHVQSDSFFLKDKY